MTDTRTIEAARQSLGRVGAFIPNIPFAEQPTVDEQRNAARRLEKAGYPTAWVNEGLGGKDGLTQLAILLAATEKLTFAAGVMNMWARPPETTHGGATFLADAFPGRFVLGIGVGYPFQAAAVGREFGSPLATARQYLSQMPIVPAITPALRSTYATILAANGPKMLQVARDAADGAMPILQPPSFTAMARELLGPDKLLVIGLTVAVDDEVARARETARAFLTQVLGVDGSPYGANLVRLGYAESDVAAIADNVLEAAVAFGRPEDVATGVQAHLDAGADHVRVGPVGSDFATGIADLERLASALAPKHARSLGR
jgi:probable F420-dependent oxidoreductase